MEPHHDGTGVVHPRHLRRVCRSTGKGVSGGEQSNSRSARDHWSRPSPTAEPTGWITHWRVPDVARDAMKHVATSFAGKSPIGERVLYWPRADERNHLFGLFYSTRVT